MLIIAAYAGYSDAEPNQYRPRLLYADEANRIVRQSQAVPVQAA